MNDTLLSFLCLIANPGTVGFGVAFAVAYRRRKQFPLVSQAAMYGFGLLIAINLAFCHWVAAGSGGFRLHESDTNYVFAKLVVGFLSGLGNAFATVLLFITAYADRQSPPPASPIIDGGRVEILIPCPPDPACPPSSQPYFEVYP